MRQWTTRRGVLRAGSTLGAIGLAGCEQQAADSATPGAGTTRGQAAPASPAVVVSRRDGVAIAVDGTTGEVGIRGDGGDDGEVLQWALSQVRDGGGRVFVRRGHYEVGRQVDVRGQYTEVVSDFARLTFADHDFYGDGDPEEQVDLNVEADHVRLRGLIVDGNKGERSTPTRTVNLSSPSHVTIRDCVVRGGRSRGDGFRGYGINPYHTNHLVVDNCLIADNDRHGIHPGSSEGPYGDVRVTNCTFLGNATDPTGAAIDVRDHTRSAVVANNYFEDNGNGVRVKGAGVGWIRVANNVLVGNRHQDGLSAQLQVWSDGAAGVEVVGNTFALSPDAGEAVHVIVATNGTVRTVTVRGNRFDGGRFGVVGAGPARWLVVEDNHFERVRRAAVNVDRAERAVVTGNRVDHAGGESDPGIAVDQVQRGLVSDNLLVDAPVDVPEHVATARNVSW